MNGVSRETAIVVSILHLSAQLDFYVIAGGIEAPSAIKFFVAEKMS